MADQILPAAATPLGDWVRQRLRNDVIAWLTTVDRRGVAQPNPIWFVWEGESILVYNFPHAKRLLHVQTHPLVTFHLETQGRGADAAVLIGTAAVATDVPPANRHAAFMDKYRDRMQIDPERWAQTFSVALRIRPTHFRGFHETSSAAEPLVR